MNKNEFLKELKQGLSGLSEQETASATEYYSEIIDDKIESGMSEEKAVESLGTTKSIIAQIKYDAVFKRLESGDKKKVFGNTGMLITALSLSPILFPLGIALIAVVFSLFVTLGALVFAFGITAVSVCVIIVPAAIQMLSGGYAFFEMTLLTGAYTMVSGLFGMLTVVAWIGFRALLFSVTKGFSKLAHRKLAKKEEAST